MHVVLASCQTEEEEQFSKITSNIHCWPNFNIFIFSFCMISWIMPAFWALYYDLLVERCTEDITFNKIFLFHRVKQTDSMLPWVCTITDHQTHLNVMRTSGHTWLHAPHASHVFIKVVKFSNSVMVPQQNEIKISKK